MSGAESEPGFGRRLLRAWLAIAARFGEVQTHVLVTGVYLSVIGPMGAAAFLTRRDLLDKRDSRPGGSVWSPADTVPQPDLERARRLF